jgi:GH25 family lysozyme M1 (1,4-beta-N-acetylmuramidase)
VASYIQGIDISKHQGNVDFSAVAASGMRFAIVKCTEGENYVDPKFRENWAKLLDLGSSTILRGAYHFARPSSTGGSGDGEAEAMDFCAELKTVGGYEDGCLPPALDFEEYSESDAHDNIPWIESFVRVVEAELGRSPMIYTGSNVWRYEVGNTDKFVSLPLWQVYYSRTAQQPPSMPWPTWTFWQWSGGGSYAYYGPVPGIPGSGVCDVNRFNGTEDQLLQLAMMGSPPMPTFPKPPLTQNLVDLRGNYSNFTARVQGLLLAHGYGPSGLVSSSGLPDGESGPKTEGYLKDFKAKHGLPVDTIVDWPTWWALVYDKLPT